MSAQKLQVFITMGLLMAVSGMLLVQLTPAAGTNTTTTTTTVATAMSFASYLIYANGNCDGDGTGETSFLGSCGQLFPGSTKVDCVDGSLNRMIYTTSDCSGTATSEVWQQSTCTPSASGTSSMFITNSPCTASGTSSSQAGNHVNILLIFSSLGLLPSAFPL